MRRSGWQEPAIERRLVWRVRWDDVHATVVPVRRVRTDGAEDDSHSRFSYNERQKR